MFIRRLSVWWNFGIESYWKNKREAKIPLYEK